MADGPAPLAFICHCVRRIGWRLDVPLRANRARLRTQKPLHGRDQ